MKNSMLLKYNYVSIPEDNSNWIDFSFFSKDPANTINVGTLLSNMARYGYTLSEQALKALCCLTPSEMSDWWKNVEPTLREITGDNLNMGDHIVYKNFPSEVLDMSLSTYWFNQVCIYLNILDLKDVQKPEKNRPALKDNIKLKVLHLANSKTSEKILGNLVKLPTKWTKEQYEDICSLAEETDNYSFLSEIPFKENMAQFANWLVSKNKPIVAKNATDVLRIAAALSDSDISLKETKFKRFKRPIRKAINNALEDCKNLEQDIAMRPELFKRLFMNTNPGDYQKLVKLNTAYDKLYKDKLPQTFNSMIEEALILEDTSSLKHLLGRPGDFMRRFKHIAKVFGKDKIFNLFQEVIPKLTTMQLLKMKGYLKPRKFRTIAPAGNWNKLEITENTDNTDYSSVISAIEKEIATRISKEIPALSSKQDLNLITLQTNNTENAAYNRGTVIRIPKNTTVIRSATYWQSKTTVWFDNGWLFYDENWQPKTACCWNNPMPFAGQARWVEDKTQKPWKDWNNKLHYPQKRVFDDTPFKNAAVFSGDPVSGQTVTGEACQMIDINLNLLAATGVRYAVFNTLSYSRVKFADCQKVVCGIQFADNALSGKVFEPSRAQVNFELNDKAYTKYVCLIDTQERTLTYLDANLASNTQSAQLNLQPMAKVLPAYMEYLSTLPTVNDIVKDIPVDSANPESICMVYSDENVEIKNKKAYVFKPLNKNNTFTQIDINKLLG